MLADRGWEIDGAIEANGIHKDASYRQEGLSHRWNFDINEKEEYEGAFIIELDGTGLYYDFSRKKKDVEPSYRTKCTKHL